MSQRVCVTVRIGHIGTTKGIQYSFFTFKNMSALADLTNLAASPSQSGGLEKHAASAIDELKEANTSKAAMKAKFNVVELFGKGAKGPITQPIVSTVGYTRLLKAMNELNSAYEELEQAEVEEGSAEQEHEDQKNNSNINALCPSAEAIQIEIEKSQEILGTLQDQKANADRSLSEKVIKRDQAILATKLQKDEFEKKMREGGDETIAKASKRVETELAQKEKEFRTKMISMGEDKIVLDALLDGMKKMNGIVDFEVPSEIEGNEMPITVEFSTGFRAVIRLGGDDMSLQDIEVLTPGAGCIVSLDATSLHELLAECKELPAPNDLRHAIFCLYSAPLAPSKLAEHMMELRKQCLVNKVGHLSIEFKLENQLTAVMTVHPCYPNVPAGVSVSRLDSYPGSKWTASEVETLKTEANSMCFSTIFFMYDYLCSK